MPTQLPDIYPITDAVLSGLPHAEQIRRLADGGARLIQFRDKHASGYEFYRSALGALETARQFGAKLIINDRVDIALMIGADGVHLGQDDLPPTRAREILGERAIIGYSTHTIEQARSAAAMPVNYIAFGPVYPTFSKANPDKIVGTDALERIRRVVPNTPIVAIGGINCDNIDEVFAAGADCAAVISYLLSDQTKISARSRELSSLARIAKRRLA